MSTQTRVSTGVQDFDLHGLVGVRLLNATAGDVATVTRQLGPLHARLDREPDVVVRFVDSLGADPLTYVGVGDAGFTADQFLLLSGRSTTGARTRIPFDHAGLHPRVLCERGVPAVPHLVTLVNLAALANGVLPLHASAFRIDDHGVLVTGWSKSGKTESLLGCVELGGRYVGDEWIYLTPDGQMFGLPEPIRLWAWHFDQQPGLLRERPRRARVRLTAWRSAAAAARTASGSGLAGAALARRALPVLERQAYLQVPPAELFGPERIAASAPLDAVVLLVSHDAPGIISEQAAPGEVAARMRASLSAERAGFMAHYEQFRYAFPDRTSPVVEIAAETEARLLARLFDHRPAGRVAHPYPCDLKELARAVRAAAATVSPVTPPADEVALR